MTSLTPLEAELLAALRRVVPIADRFLGEMDWPSYSDLNSLKTANAAIARAEGKAQS